MRVLVLLLCAVAARESTMYVSHIVSHIRTYGVYFPPPSLLLLSSPQVVKIPRFDLKKFQKVSNMVGSAMKSVGEVMAIGRKFEEVFQKALRMLHPSVAGFEPLKKKGDEEEKKEHQKDEMDRSVVERLKIPDYERVFAVADAFDEGMSVDEIHDLCKVRKQPINTSKQPINTCARYEREREREKDVCCTVCVCVAAHESESIRVYSHAGVYFFLPRSTGGSCTS
jgi:hypothetical protein